MKMEKDPRVFYNEIDKEGIIRKVNQNWLDFAKENDASQLTEEKILGTSLWEYFSESETIRIYQIIVKKVHEVGHPISVRFRCDSPEMRREMLMTIEAMDDGGTGFSSHVLKMEKRDRVVILDANSQKSNRSLLICSWCKKVKMMEANWLEVEDAVDAMHLMEEPLPPSLIECICPFCYEDILEQIHSENEVNKVPSNR